MYVCVCVHVCACVCVCVKHVFCVRILVRSIFFVRLLLLFSHQGLQFYRTVLFALCYELIFMVLLFLCAA